jgi:glutaredoxin 3
MDNKRKVEIFSGGCALCQEVIDVVRREAGSSFEVIVRNMMDARSLGRAEELGIRSVPAVLINGKLASNAGGGVDIEALKSELVRTPKV